MSTNESCPGNGVREVTVGIACVHLILPRHENISGIPWDEKEQLIIIDYTTNLCKYRFICKSGVYILCTIIEEKTGNK